MMTRFEKIRTMSFDDMVQFLCQISGDGDRYRCDSCKASAECFYGHKGFIEWLTQEVDESDDLIGE